jgi:hypothetical protein
VSKLLFDVYTSSTLAHASTEYDNSTGGILALALGIMDWPVDHCMKLFLRLVDKAFTPKVLGGVTFGNPNYRTKPLQEALCDSFEEETMFGGRRDTPIACSRKVAVTSAKRTGEQAVVFTNYNRKEDKQGRYLSHEGSNLC